MKQKKTDLLDIIITWKKNHPEFKNLYHQKIVNDSVSDGGVLLFHRESPHRDKGWVARDIVSGDPKLTSKALNNYLMTISIKGSIWDRKMPNRQLDIFSPTLFEHIGSVLRSVCENR